MRSGNDDILGKYDNHREKEGEFVWKRKRKQGDMCKKSDEIAEKR